MSICYDPFQMFDVFFYFMVLESERSMRRFRTISLLMTIVPLIVIGVVALIIVIVLFKKGVIGGGGSKPIDKEYQKSNRIDRINRFGNKISTKLGVQIPKVEISKSTKDQITEKLIELDYKCKYCHAELKGGVCEYCGRTNFTI